MARNSHGSKVPIALGSVGFYALRTNPFLLWHRNIKLILLFSEKREAHGSGQS